MADRTPIIDVDLHPAPDWTRVRARLGEPFATRLAGGNRGPGHLNYWNPTGVMRVDAVAPDGRRIESDPDLLGRHFLDPHGIAYGVLNPAGTLSIGLSPDLDYTTALLSAVNDHFLEDWLPHDPRLRYSVMVHPGDPQHAAREIRRVGARGGVAQILMPSAALMPYGHRAYHPIYEAAQELGLPVAIHPGTEGVGVSGAPTAAGYPSSYLEWHTGLVGNYIAHLVSLVTEGVFQKFPRLKFVLLEGGVFWLPSLLWRLDKNWKGLRLTVPWLDRLPSEIVAQHVLLSTQPLEEPEQAEHFRAMLGMFDAGGMLMFSSDFPHWDGDTPDFAARAFPAELRPRVMFGTAAELYGLEVRAHA